jgi:hypothetical protein
MHFLSAFSDQLQAREVGMGGVASRAAGRSHCERSTASHLGGGGLRLARPSLFRPAKGLAMRTLVTPKTGLGQIFVFVPKDVYNCGLDSPPTPHVFWAAVVLVVFLVILPQSRLEAIAELMRYATVLSTIYVVAVRTASMSHERKAVHLAAS